MNALMSRLESLKVGEAVAAVDGVAWFPLLAAAIENPFYLTLAEAVAKGGFVVTEMSAGGVVNTLQARNDLDVPVLILDGEQLIGAKQNRIVNLSILVPARATISLPVSCVERGRWAWKSESFGVSEHHMPVSMRAAKSFRVSENLREQGRPDAEQGAVWQEASNLLFSLDCPSSTDAVEEAFVSRREEIGRVEKELVPSALQVGALFAVAGVVRGLDVFDAQSSFHRHAPKIVRSYALEAARRRGGSQAEPPAESAATRFLETLAEARLRSYDVVGEGRQWRIEHPELGGEVLVAGDTVVHASIFRDLR